MSLATRLKAAYAGLALADAALSTSRRPWAHKARFVTKPLLMPLLSASLVTTPGSSSARRPVLLAQAAGWVGDVALLSEHRRPFVVGTAAFGAGHLAYLAAFAPRGRAQPPPVRDPRARALAALWAATAPVMAWDARRDGVAGTVATYSALLTSMAVSATRLDADQPAAARRLIAAGALTFLASDATLGMRKFVLDEPSPVVEGVVMATYTAAQVLLSEGASRL